MGSGMVARAHTRCPSVLEHGTRAHHLSVLPPTCGVEGDMSSLAMYVSQHPCTLVGLSYHFRAQRVSIQVARLNLLFTSIRLGYLTRAQHSIKNFFEDSMRVFQYFILIQCVLF